jgi:hypothetical protein
MVGVTGDWVGRVSSGTVQAVAFRDITQLLCTKMSMRFYFFRIPRLVTGQIRILLPPPHWLA